MEHGISELDDNFPFDKIRVEQLRLKALHPVINYDDFYLHYQDLIVRIGGYSDYFVRLPETMQQEVLLRTEHAL